MMQGALLLSQLRKGQLFSVSRGNGPLGWGRVEGGCGQSFSTEEVEFVTQQLPFWAECLLSSQEK